MRMRVWTVVGVVALAGSVVFATAQEPRRQGRPDRATLEKELGLTADQAAQLRKLRAEGRKQAIRQRADLAIARLELQELMDGPTVDEKAVTAKAKAIGGLQAAAFEARTSQRLAMRRLLTPEQQEKLKQLAPRRRGAGAGRRGAGPAFPGPRGWEEDDATPSPAEPER
jgi:Spy/CpxP family protein refolding chaperone